MIRRHHAAFRLALMAADGLLATALFVAISVARFGDDWQATWIRAGFEPWLLGGAYGVAWVTVIWVHDLYRLRARFTLRSEILDIVRASIMLAVATFSALFLLHFPDVSRFFLLTLFGAQIVLAVASRIVLRSAFAWARGHGFSTRHVVIVGDGRAARRFADRIEGHRELGLRVIGHLSTSRADGLAGGRPIIGTIDDIEEVLHGRVVDEVAICLPPDRSALVEPITRLCQEEGKIVRIPLDEQGWSVPGGRLEEFDGRPILSLVYGPDRILSLLGKRAIDIVLGVAALVVLSPLLLVVAGVLRAVDGGPVLFRQERVGLHGRTFRVLKFRTMTPDAEGRLEELEALNEIRGPAFKVTDDPRLTRTGRFLRATSLDEIPQIWNVLRGEMSLVGPRPPLAREVAGYDLWHRRRLSMKPGITGLWQVMARREADFDRWVELDLAYIDRWSIWLDVKIILRTIPAMLQGR